MTVKIAPEGGLYTEMPLASGGTLDLQILWGAYDVTIKPAVGSRSRIPAIVADLATRFGGGLHVDFDQSLLSAVPGCAPAASAYLSQVGLIASELGVDANAPDSLRLIRERISQLKSAAPKTEETVAVTASEGYVLREALQRAGFHDRALASEDPKTILQYLTERRVELEALRQAAPPRGPELGSGSKSAEAPQAADQIAGVPVAEAQPKGDAKPTVSKKKAAAKKPADPGALATGGVVPSADQKPAPTSPFGAKPTDGDFAEVARDIDQRQQAERHPAEPRFRAEEQQVPATPGEPLTYVPLSPQENPAEPPSDLDNLVRLLTEPPMPPDLNPFAIRRRPTDRHFADSAYIRIYFGEALPPRYAKDPGYEPAQPAAPRVDLYPDEGVNERIAAAVELLTAVNEHAKAAGVEIPQLAGFLDVYETPAECARAVKDIVEKRK